MTDRNEGDWKSYQDWQPVVLKKSSKPTNIYNNSKENPSGFKEFKKLEEDDIPKLNKITQEQRQRLIDARNAKKFTQSDLAKMIPGLSVSIIASYENGTVTNFNITFYNKLLRVLGCKP